ncbi:MAG: hypothetical protein IAX21_09075 [Candidatus Bathyarchaeota archaeon]|nr:molybdopterin-binding protein [Candidatus Bathyarchaeum tardum]WGM88975.1 MAG: molybdopterin-binding protein [Candidatus Bathyarchaeum tardum]WNZ28788.1 MAG: hypothetical protein IAX21_09075 [Candidatus Bathyarchaeota archaeon]
MNEDTNKSKSSRTINFSVIICSSSLYQQFKENENFVTDSLDLIVDLVTDAGHQVVSTQFMPDDRVMLTKQVGNAISSNIIDVIIVCGGTGLSVSEITLEALRPLMIKTMPGFAEILRKLYYDKFGSTAIISRALAGITDQQKILFCIPNSPDSINLAFKKLILPEIGNLSAHEREH